MTIAAVWLDKDGLWCASDTRISNPGSGDGKIVVTDAGAKIFSINVECREASIPPTLYFQRKFGLVFAGKTSIAMNTLATASLMCSLLQGAKGERPSMQDIVVLVSKVLRRYSNDFRASHNDHTPLLVEMLLFGCDPLSNMYKIFKINDKFENDRLYVDYQELPCVIGNVFAIGSQVEAFNAKLKEQLEVQKREHPLPIAAIREMALANQGDVGGSVTLAFCNQSQDFTVMWTLWVHGEPLGQRLINGFDLAEIGYVGPLFVGGGGMYA